jgi:tetratricopeptide (TPR) repeat protein
MVAAATAASCAAVAPETPNAPTTRPSAMIGTPPPMAITSSDERRTDRPRSTRSSISIVVIQPDALSWVQVANAYLHLDGSDEAVAAFRKATEIDPTDGTAFFELAGALWNKGERDEAVSIWWEALGSFPQHELRDQALDCVVIHLAGYVSIGEAPADPTNTHS